MSWKLSVSSGRTAGLSSLECLYGKRIRLRFIKENLRISYSRKPFPLHKSNSKSCQSQVQHLILTPFVHVSPCTALIFSLHGKMWIRERKIFLKIHLRSHRFVLPTVERFHFFLPCVSARVSLCCCSAKYNQEHPLTVAFLPLGLYRVSWDWAQAERFQMALERL